MLLASVIADTEKPAPECDSVGKADVFLHIATESFKAAWPKVKLITKKREKAKKRAKQRRGNKFTRKPTSWNAKRAWPFEPKVCVLGFLIGDNIFNA